MSIVTKAMDAFASFCKILPRHHAINDIYVITVIANSDAHWFGSWEDANSKWFTIPEAPARSIVVA